MDAVGIVAEYNPLHWGHVYHIRKTRNIAGGAPVIAVISSNFVQRGEPAFVGKGLRAAMALSGGVDLALELPVVFSSHNAGVFANAAVDILAATGLVSAISFGMETPDLGLTERLADILNSEPRAFRESLEKFLAEGYSFVQSRGMALEETVPGGLELLRRPNGNLALAYVKRLREKHYNITPRAVERIGAGFHDTEISTLPAPPANPEESPAASAAAIRALIRGGREDAYSLLPPESARILREADAGGRTAKSRDRLWRAVKQAIIRAGADGLRGVSEMGEGLENRMTDLAYRSASYDAFVDACASRRYTKGRIQRHAAHLLMNLSHEESRLFQRRGPAYIRVLGANRAGRALLSSMRKTAALPVISRASAPWDEYASAMMDFEHRSTELWETLTENPGARAEARLIPVIRD